MGRVAILKIGAGNFDRGFAVSLQIGEENSPLLGEVEGRLPPNSDIEGFYISWQTRFRSLNAPYENARRIRRSWDDEDWEIDESAPINRSMSDDIAACRRLVKTLETSMKNWLQQSADRDWQKIRERLVREFANHSEGIRLVIKTKEPKVWKLPWHVWDLLEENPDVGISYSPPEFEPAKVTENLPVRDRKVRILAILGDDRDINLEADRVAIEALNDAEAVFLDRPRPRNLIEKLRDKKGWDILFFAGHSHTESDTGRIYLNENESLEVDEFKNAIKEAIRQGLKIAIFNSCDGLGFAQRLADLHIPVTIAMQEEVPDRVAQSFLKEFLAEYAGGRSLTTSVRRSQERLEEFQDLPGCTWLPAICLNPAEIPPTWAELRDGKQRDRQPIWHQFHQVALTSLCVTFLLLVGRNFGLLQPLELSAFDRFMQMQPPEKPDDRILVVTVTEDDLNYQDEKGWKREAKSLADPALAKALEKLNQYQPRAIGLDLYRDFPADPTDSELKTQLQNDRLIATCLVGGTEKNRLGISPPPEIKEDYRLGFSNFPEDPNGVIRRQFLGMSPDNTCQTSQSLSLQVALRYLEGEKISSIGFNSNQKLQIDKVIFPKVDASAGGYQLPATEAQGYQILLNYRTGSAIARQVTLKELIEGSIDSELPELVKDKIILIGTTAKNYQDWHLTPYSTGQWPQKMPGVMIHAQMVSQILSSVLNGRPLLRWWPQELEILWIWSWSLVGGTIGWYFVMEFASSRDAHSTKKWTGFLAGGGAIATLSGLCFIFLINGVWIPFIPAGLALIFTGLSMVLLIVLIDKK